MNKTALVTGSSRGIGKSVVIELAKAGFTVLLHGSRKTDQLGARHSSTPLLRALQQRQRRFGDAYQSDGTVVG